MNASVLQILITALLSSGFVGGLVALFTKQVWSPEAKNDLSRLGNEFARQLLSDAKAEREELRLTIHELENNMATTQVTVARLNAMAEEKDRVIAEFEQRLTKMARKLQQGLPISMQDIFGDKAPKEFTFGPSGPV